MLHNYICRVCDTNLESVERFETAMKRWPPWEPLVERTYGIGEQKVLDMFQTIKEASPGTSDLEIVDGISAFLIDSHYGLDDIPFGDPFSDAIDRESN